MLANLLAAILPVGLLFLGVVCVLIPMLLWRRSVSRHKRESPLTRNMLRPPGYSLGLKVDDLSEEISFYLLSIMAAPVLLFSLHISQSYFGGEPESYVRATGMCLVGLVIILFIARRLNQLLKERRQKRLGFEGEMFTGEELNQLMLNGCRVFHDIEFPYGNIDHVVVGKSGVYSVNTKMRGKPKVGEGRAEVIVDHDKEVIRFPDWDYKIPVAQLETEAKWLSQFLTSSTGESIAVEPMLALPGWYIKDRIGRGAAFVFNPQSPKRFFVQNRQVLTETQIKKITHQLEQLCRNVKPSFREDKSWSSKQIATSKS
ncbi:MULTISPECIES: nuclease-related domain-containing protein [Pirellulaceae]|nr:MULTISPECIES: nuclease-related domain-containing protein [Pirellulaceae]